MTASKIASPTLCMQLHVDTAELRPAWQSGTAGLTGPRTRRGRSWGIGLHTHTCMRTQSVDRTKNENRAGERQQCGARLGQDGRGDALDRAAVGVGRVVGGHARRGAGLRRERLVQALDVAAVADRDPARAALVHGVVVDGVGALVRVHVAVHDDVHAVRVQVGLDHQAAALELLVMRGVAVVGRRVPRDDDPGRAPAVHAADVVQEPGELVEAEGGVGVVAVRVHDSAVVASLGGRLLLGVVGVDGQVGQQAAVLRGKM